jgi:D-alanyl-D-alanine carboxypeptidase/D-alanyl-D-alanine-endopeptidase (penicillin-binding protein 4)
MNSPVTSPSSSSFENNFSTITNASRYAHASWGVIIVDPATNRTLYENDADQMFVPGSTVKLFTAASALEALGPDYRFKTPVYTIGSVDGHGNLTGNLVLVASGDPDMGGRTLPDDTIAYTNTDHGDANALGGATLTSTNPLAGLDDLAMQVQESGITEVSDVVVDDRLFTTTDLGKTYVISPICINDDQVDITITPADSGAAASLAMRPQTAAYTLVNKVMTGKTGEPLAVSITEDPKGVIVVQGTIAADAGPVNQTYTIKTPAAFARTLFIEALTRQGIHVTAVSTGDNPSVKLPAPDEYTDIRKVAELTSPPFSEDVKLTLKVSQNLHADTYVSLNAAASNKTDFYDGMIEEGTILRSIGLDTRGLSLGDGEGGVSEDRISPRSAAEFLTLMTRRPYAEAYRNALPILGVDGSLATSCSPDSPARGHVYAKTGTTGSYDPLNDHGILLAKSLVGYVDTSHGKRLVFAIYVNNAAFENVDDMMATGNDLGSIAEAIYTNY